MSTDVGEPTPTPTGTSLVGQVVSGRYRIERMLGEGGMGAVFLAEHTHMRKRVALKLLHAEMSKDTEVLARFRREAEAAARVEHPNVAAATDFGQLEDGSFFLILEYVEGTSLRDALRGGALGARRSLHVTRQIALALERAHALGIVHRDLKPENVMLVQKGDDPDFVKVLDFGIAKVEPHATRDAGAQPLTRFGAIIGTPEYMAPEQALGETVGPPADLYALGVMLYEMLTGRHPFDADDRMAVLSMHIVAPVPPMADRNPHITVPAPVEELAKRLLEKDGAQRPAGARALIEQIDAVAAQSGIEMPYATGRVIGGDSGPGGSAPPGEATTGAGQWRADDSLAKTDYHLPSVRDIALGAPRPATGGSTSALDRLRELPRGVLIAIAAVVPLLVIALLLAIVLSGRSSDTQAQADGGAVQTPSVVAKAFRSSHASAEELQTARTSGVSALESLATKFPEDPAVQSAYARALGEAGKTSDMLRVAKGLAALDKGAIDDALLDAIEVAAQRGDTTEDAFALLEGPLGARGVDGLLELSTTKKVPLAVQRRAAKSLARPEVRANASPATSVFIDFKDAKTCPDRHDLLERVAESGDARLLPTLKQMKNPRGCGFLGTRDCWACLRKDDSLENALKAVGNRPAP